jgi:Ca2+-transporting ATPase
MRGAGSPVFRNAITLNPFVWLAVALCAAILLLAVYIPLVADALQVIPPDQSGWVLVMAASLTPLLVGMTIGAMSAGPRRKTVG